MTRKQCEHQDCIIQHVSSLRSECQRWSHHQHGSMILFACLIVSPNMKQTLNSRHINTSVHESQGHECSKDTRWETWSDHSCILLNAKCWRLAPHNLKNEKVVTASQRYYVYIIAIIISQWIQAIDRNRALLHIATMVTQSRCVSHTESERRTIVAMCRLHRIWATTRNRAFLHIATMFT